MARKKDENKLPKFNKKLILEVKEHILEEPKRLDMGSFACAISDEHRTRYPQDYPNCGTIACIAGWTVLLHDKKTEKARREMAGTTYNVDWYVLATEYLGLTDNEADAMFLNWENSVGTAAANEAARKIDACIAARNSGIEWDGYDGY